MSHPRQPCKRCDGPKPVGSGRKFCAACAVLSRERAAANRRERERLESARRAGEKPQTPPGTKWCRRCESYLPIDSFGTRGPKKRAGYCRPCASEYNHEHRLLKAFGLTLDDYDRLLGIQDGRCAICECRPRTRRLSVDHDHKTGAIRGLLCTRCNHKLLGAAHDSAVMLRRAARYLEAPPAITRKPVPNDDQRTDQ